MSYLDGLFNLLVLASGATIGSTTTINFVGFTITKNADGSITIAAATALTGVTSLTFDAGAQPPQITQTKFPGTGGGGPTSFTIQGATGQDRSGDADNTQGENVALIGGDPGTGGSGQAGARGDVTIHGGDVNILADAATANTPGTLAIVAGGAASLASPDIQLVSGTSILNQTMLHITNTSLGFHGVSPVAQATRAGQVTDSTGGTVSTTFAAITAGASYSQSDMTAVKNALSSIAAQYNKLDTILHNLGLSA